MKFLKQNVATATGNPLLISLIKYRMEMDTTLNDHGRMRITAER